jgi:hypothetical protein
VHISDWIQLKPFFSAKFKLFLSKKNRFQEPTLEVKTDDVGDPMVRAMATCHSLALKTSGVASSNSWCRCCVGDQSKSLLGDPLDLMAFKFTKWVGPQLQALVLIEVAASFFLIFRNFWNEPFLVSEPLYCQSSVHR